MHHRAAARSWSRRAAGRPGSPTRITWAATRRCRRAGPALAPPPGGVVGVPRGGPRILARGGEVVGRRGPQVQASRDVLRDCGNMSSATLPHIWARLLDDRGVARGTPIASLAFGPG